VSSEQCSSDCAPSFEVIPRQAVTAPASLIARPAADHIQAGNSDIQNSEHIHSGLSSSQITECTCSCTSHSSAIALLDQPFMRTDFCTCAFRFSAPSVWYSLPQTVLISDSLTVFKSGLKTFLFNQALLNIDPTCHQCL